jgi:hypothetical protein
MKKQHFGLILAALALVVAAPAWPQAVSVLNPLARQYEFKSFVFTPPSTDGWREMASAPDAARLVYAERIDEEAINTRADFTAQSFDIDDPSQAPDPFTLARISLAQRVEEKGEALVALSQVQPVQGELGVHEYALVIKVGEDDIFEHYFVALAPDKSEYLAAKLITKDSTYREEPYFRPLYEAVGSMKFKGATSAASGANDEPAGEPGGDQAAAGNAADADEASKTTDPIETPNSADDASGPAGD